MVRFNIFDISRRRLFVILLAAFAFAFAIWFINTLPYKGFWDHFYTYKQIGTHFCEQTNMEALIRQPINTFSNFIYLLAAMAILRRGFKDRHKRNRYNIISANPFYSITLGCILIYIFSASVFFHSSLIVFASDMDYSAVYSLSLFPLMYFTHRVWLLRIGVASNQRHPLSTRTLIIVFSALYLLLTFFWPQRFSDEVVLGLIIALVIFGFIVEYEDPGKTNRYYLLTSIVTILFAVMWFIFDQKKIICNPESVIQPHSLWHLFSGISVFYFYMYIRSEKNRI
ncbi:MAG TPA: ceramidase domain-containing protein [Chitinophagales bacterium]|nr:ceramidase domain-containing protein [Chitinophagales bacterium]